MICSHALFADGTQILGSTFRRSGEDGVNGTAEEQQYTATKYNYGDESRGEIILAPNGTVSLPPARSQLIFRLALVLQATNAGGQDI